MTEINFISALPEIIARAPGRARVAVERACVLIVGRAKMHSRVRTGLMRSEWQFEMLSDEEGRVFDIVRYTVYNEYGTRYMAAQPMLRPAIAETTPEFEGLVADIFEF